MGSRTWIKLYCDKWLNGTIREESLEVRAVWVDLLVLAGSGKYGDSGEIKITDSVGLLDQQIADLLQISTRKWKIISKRLQETDRICINQRNVLGIKNWSKYQSEYERTKPYRNRVESAESTVESTPESTAKDTVRDRDRERDERLETRDPPLLSPQVCPSLESIINAYQDNILLGGTATEEMEHELKSACRRYTEQWVLDAMKEALEQNQPTWRYIMGILKNWSREGKL